MNTALAASTLVCIVGAAACAAPSAAPESAGGASSVSADAPAAARLLVKLVRPSADAAAVTRMVSAAAGVPASYLAETSPQWHAVALHCGSMPDCDAAVLRLRRDAANFEAVQRDDRRRVGAP